MKKTKILFILIFSIIVLTVVIFYFKTKFYTEIEIKEDKSLITKIQSEVDTSTYLDLNIITNFQWDKVYIVTPYIKLKNVFEENNIEPANIDQSIQIHDDINLMLFTLNKTIVAYVNLPRSIADFSYLESAKFDKNKARFNINKDKNGVKLVPSK